MTSWRAQGNSPAIQHQLKIDWLNLLLFLRRTICEWNGVCFVGFFSLGGYGRLLAALLRKEKRTTKQSKRNGMAPFIQLIIHQFNLISIKRWPHSPSRVWWMSWLNEWMLNGLLSFAWFFGGLWGGHRPMAPPKEANAKRESRQQQSFFFSFSKQFFLPFFVDCRTAEGEQSTKEGR